MVNRVLGFSKGMFFSFKRFMLLGWSNKAVGKSRAEIAVCTSHPLVLELQFAHHPIFLSQEQLMDWFQCVERPVKLKLCGDSTKPSKGCPL